MDEQDVWRKYTIDEVAAKLEVSPRWLADECRAGRVTHVHMARKRWFTLEQVQTLIAQHTVRSEADRHRDVVRERLERSFRRPKMTQVNGQWVVVNE